MNEAKASQSKRDIICVSVCVSLPVIGPNTKWDGVISRCWSNMVRKSAHRQWYCMSMRLRRLTWDPDHALITLKWTNFEKKKYLELSYILILIISAPEGSTHTQSENRRVFLPPPPFPLLLLLLTEILLSWCGGVQKKKKKEERKNSLGHLAEDLTCSLAVRGRVVEYALFPTLAIFRFRDWKVKRCSYRWKPSSLSPLSMEVRAACNNPDIVLTRPVCSQLTHPK